MRIRALCLTSLLSVILMLQGCSSIFLPVNTKPASNFSLTTVNPDSIHAKRSASILLVSQPTAAPGYGTSRMIYVKRPYELSFYVYNSWIMSPTSMLLPLVVKSIENTGRYQAVVAPPYAGLVNNRLDISQVTLYQQVMTEPNFVVLSARAQLVNTSTHKVLATKQIRVKEKVTANDPYAGVEAANRATSKFLASLAKFVVQKAA